MKTVAIIQARMASTRLPGKVMAEVADKLLLEHVIRRAERATSVDLVIVATTDHLADDVVAQFCSKLGVQYFRGSEDDVLDRYYRAAKHFGAEAVVRLTADCPLLDPAVIDKVVREFHSGGYDYVSNAHEPTYPDGLDTEVFGFRALEGAWLEAELRSEREHVTPYIWKHAEMFRLGNVRYEPDLSALRWTVDEPEDLEFVRKVYGCLASKPFFGMSDVLALMAEHPELAALNAAFERNQGYSRSVADDRLEPGRVQVQ